MEGICLSCEQPFQKFKKSQKFCSERCRSNWHNKRENRKTAAERPIKRKNGWKPTKNEQAIIDINLKAMELGLSYGQYEMHRRIERERGQASSSKSMQASSIDCTK